MIKQYLREWWSDLRHMYNTVPQGIRKALAIAFWIVVLIAVALVSDQ